MQCDFDVLSLYIDGELGTSRRQILELHLNECDSCRTRLSELRANDRLLVQWGAVREPMPVATHSRIMRDIQPHSMVAQLLKWSRMMPAAVGTTAAAFLVLLSVNMGPLLGLGVNQSATSSTRMAHLIATQSAPLLKERRTTAILPGRDTTAQASQLRRSLQFEIE